MTNHERALADASNAAMELLNIGCSGGIAEQITQQEEIFHDACKVLSPEEVLSLHGGWKGMEHIAHSLGVELE